MIMGVFKIMGVGKVTLAIITVLGASQAASIYFLKRSYDLNKEAQHSVEQWRSSSQTWEREYQRVDKQLADRELARNKLAVENKQLQKEISEVVDETDILDSRMPDDLIRLLKSN